MLLIVGLGNPGRKFQRTRHNLGWMVLDLLQKKYEKEHGLSEWKKVKKFKSEISQGKIKNQKIILAKPTTFMNLSGQAVKLMTSFYKIQPRNLIVIHDDIDISLGKIKIIKNRGTAGHKGIQSIISELKTKNFTRLRIGIKPTTKPKNTEKFVLLKFNKEEEKTIKEVAQEGTAAVGMITTRGLGEAMSEFNKKKPR